ncbi:MAG: SPOR domain-containing protein [Thiobacillus sp.]|nr:SPOR domain-containing protein [Thiobacillus sp.]
MAKPASRPAKRGGSSIFTGVLIGLAVGAILAVGVALWITGNNPFKADTVASPAPQTPAPPPKPDTAPSFDFYKVLPNDTAADLPGPAPDVAAPPAGPKYYLQAGAFQNPADADNLKAQLALLGVEAVIQTSDLGEKGVFHRVRVGPFRAMDEVNRTRSLLAQNNIAATLVRDEPNQQETP